MFHATLFMATIYLLDTIKGRGFSKFTVIETNLGAFDKRFCPVNEVCVQNVNWNVNFPPKIHGFA